MSTGRKTPTQQQQLLLTFILVQTYYTVALRHKRVHNKQTNAQEAHRSTRVEGLSKNKVRLNMNCSFVNTIELHKTGITTGTSVAQTTGELKALLLSTLDPDVILN